MLLAEGYRNGFDRLFAGCAASPAGPTTAQTPFESYGLHRDGTEFHGEMACSLLRRRRPAGPVASVRATSTGRGRRRPEGGDVAAERHAGVHGGRDTGGRLRGKIAGLNEQFPTMWGIPPDMMRPIRRASHAADLMLGEGPEASWPRSRNCTRIPAAESHDTMDFLDGRTFERYSRPQKVGDRWWAGSGASAMSRRGAGPRSRPSRPWPTWPHRPSS